MEGPRGCYPHLGVLTTRRAQPLFTPTFTLCRFGVRTDPDILIDGGVVVTQPLYNAETVNLKTADVGPAIHFQLTLRCHGGWWGPNCNVSCVGDTVSACTHTGNKSCAAGYYLLGSMPGSCQRMCSMVLLARLANRIGTAEAQQHAATAAYREASRSVRVVCLLITAYRFLRHCLPACPPGNGCVLSQLMPCELGTFAAGSRQSLCWWVSRQSYEGTLPSAVTTAIPMVHLIHCSLTVVEFLRTRQAVQRVLFRYFSGYAMHPNTRYYMRAGDGLPRGSWRDRGAAADDHIRSGVHGQHDVSDSDNDIAHHHNNAIGIHPHS